MASRLGWPFIELAHAVVIIDEVEEVAEFRDREGLLLSCATNFIRALDAAFLRHGRFDFVLPIGLPDREARIAIWKRYRPDTVARQIDFGALSEAREGMTPADIAYAARRASQDALARELTTVSYIDALSVPRATVSP